ncbi:DUF4390 domain-containing protein [Pusillimonas sp. TS35]|uniref:DUF4390 domain-containing protein n=1 Tax=Paracandidimonas lactea TaxID=2895524 RepID=UPI0013705C00|nr:DUF4390 domain-containing protein [Paracandidimonas lactea]MYN13003.1 DUF4390 domain-containing protein [Pusillimonas sp. TS35]
MLRLLLPVLMSLLLVAQAYSQVPAQAERVVRIEPIVRDGKLYIDADIEMAVTGDVRNVAEKGVPLYFTADLEIIEPRWWWLDKTVVDEQLTWRIVYNALTRQWRAGAGDLSLPESSLDDALSLVRHIRGWAVADTELFEHDKQYQGRLRLRLDTSMLARPFQVDAYNSSAWSLATPWKDFTFTISVDAPQR